MPIALLSGSYRQVDPIQRPAVRMLANLLLKIGEGFCSETGDLLATKDAVRALLDRLPGDCTLEDVLYHLYVVHAVARGEAADEAGRTIPHEQVEAELRRRWLLGRAR